MCLKSHSIWKIKNWYILGPSSIFIFIFFSIASLWNSLKWNVIQQIKNCGLKTLNTCVKKILKNILTYLLLFILTAPIIVVPFPHHSAGYTFEPGSAYNWWTFITQKGDFYNIKGYQILEFFSKYFASLGIGKRLYVMARRLSSSECSGVCFIHKN